MSQGDEPVTGDQPNGDSLAAYRRLIELQRQMIELGQQHEQSKRECATLREQVTQAASARRRNGKTMRHRLRESAARLLRRMPGFSVATNPVNVFKARQPHN
jgi:hypothetical protein